MVAKNAPSKGNEFLGKLFVFPPPGAKTKKGKFFSCLYVLKDRFFFFLNFPLTETVVTQSFLLFIKVLIPFPVNPPFSLGAQRLYLLVFHECYTSSPQVSG